MSLNSIQNSNNITAYESIDITSEKNDNLPAATGFSKLLSESTATIVSPANMPPTNWLTSPEHSDANRPNMMQFINATGLNSKDASELLYGVVGANSDCRNWQKIMTSEDPVSASRAATNAMYNQTSSPNTVQVEAQLNHLTYESTIAKSENFAITKLPQNHNSTAFTEELKLVGSNGLVLRNAGNDSDAINHNTWLFGFNAAPLTELKTKAPLQLQKIMELAANSPSYNPKKFDLNESINLFLKSTGTDSSLLIKEPDSK